MSLSGATSLRDFLGPDVVLGMLCLALLAVVALFWLLIRAQQARVDQAMRLAPLFDKVVDLAKRSETALADNTEALDDFRESAQLPPDRRASRRAKETS